MSGEIDSGAYDSFSQISNEIEARIKNLESNEYGTEIDSLGIIPIIVNLTPDLENAGFFKERMLFSHKKKEADYRLRIDYNRFINSDNRMKKLLIIKNIIDSIRLLGKKAKKDFNAKKLEDDILMLFEVRKETIDNL